MRNRSRIFSILLVCLLLTAPALVLAQTTGTIEGTITDQSGAALPGVTVDLASASLQGARSAVTSADGRYRFLSVAPGAYTVTATLSGFGRVQKKATVTLDATVTANLSMNLSTTAEVTVTGEAPLIDTSSTTGGSTYTAKVMSGLPLGRNYTDVVKSNPGVNEDRGETQGRAQRPHDLRRDLGREPVHHRRRQHDQRHQGLPGQVAQRRVHPGSRGQDRRLPGRVRPRPRRRRQRHHEVGRQRVPRRRVRLLRLVRHAREAGSLPARAGHRAGRHDLQRHGPRHADRHAHRRLREAGRRLRPRRLCLEGPDLVLHGVRPRDLPDADGRALRRLRDGQQQRPVPAEPVGQPLLRQADLQHRAGHDADGLLSSTTRRSSTGAAGSDPRQSRVATITSHRGAHLGVPPRHRRPGLGRPPEPAHRLGRPRPVAGRPAQGPLPVEALGRGLGHPLQRLHLRRRHRRCAVRRARRGQLDDRRLRTDLRPDGQQLLEAHDVQGRLHLLPRQQRGEGGRATTRRARRTRSRSTRASARVAIRAASSSRPSTSTARHYYQHNFFAPCADRTDVACQVPINNVIAPSSKDLGWYIQDSFKVTPSFTINAGLRWDKEDVNDYTGATAFSTTNEWQPRIGVIWDPNANGQMKVYAFYGRFYYSLPTDLNVRAYGAQTRRHDVQLRSGRRDPGPERHRSRDPVLPGRRLHRAGAAGPEGHLPGRVSAGFDMLLDPSFSVGVKGMYRNLGNTIEDRCDLDGSSPLTNFNTCAIINPGSDSPLATGTGPGLQRPRWPLATAASTRPGDRQGQAARTGAASSSRASSSPTPCGRRPPSSTRA